MNLYDYILKARNNDTESINYLILKFTPLILKYSNKLYIPEDGKSELLLHFFETINKLPLDKKQFKEDKYIISYINTSIRRHFFHLYSIEKKYCFTEVNVSSNENLLCSSSNNSNIIFYDLIKNLKPKEQFILEKKYIYNFTNSEIAKSLHISRQNVQACINRALFKLKKSV